MHIISKSGTSKIFKCLKFKREVYKGDSRQPNNETDATLWWKLGPEQHEGNYVEVEWPEFNSILFHCLLCDNKLVKEVMNEQGEVKIPAQYGPIHLNL